MSDKTQNQHFVPQSYMKRFAENGKISVFSKADNKVCTKQNPRNYAASRYYYDTNRLELEILMKELIELKPAILQHVDWNDPQLIEHYFSQSEAAVKTLFDRIEVDPDQIDADGTIAQITIFIHDLAYRNPAYRDGLVRNNEITYNVLTDMNLTEVQKKYAEEEYGQNQARIQQLHTITDVAPVLQTYKMLFEGYELFFAEAKEDAQFLISDDPAYAVRLSYPEICFPLSGKHALLFRKPNISSPLMGNDIPNGNRISISVGNVAKHNLLQFCAASRFVFGDTFNLEQMKLLWEHRKKV